MIKLKDILFEGKLTESWSYRDYTYDQIHDIKGRIAYAQKALKQKDIKDWEKKEFTALLKDLKKTLRIKSDHLKWIDKMEKQMGEGKLSEKVNQSKVNSSFYKVVAFIRKESKKLNDDDLYAMTRKLEKWLK